MRCVYIDNTVSFALYQPTMNEEVFMKKSLTLAGLLTASPLLFALNCGNLGIKIINNTNQDCQLKNKIISYGMLDQGTPPLNIPKGSESDLFFMYQDNVGVGVQLNYQCGDKRVKFYSYQEYCLIRAGDVGGSWDVWNDLALVNHPKMGSYWSSLPGQITWEIQE